MITFSKTIRFIPIRMIWDSAGTSRVNAVDVIYAAMPIYVYLNPDILGYLLNPLLE